MAVVVVLIGRTCLATDPGENAGGAISVLGQIVACGLLQKDGKRTPFNPHAWLTHHCLPAFDHHVIELPRVSKQTKNPASIVTLSVTAGRLIERYPAANIVTTFVDQWKGSVEKKEHNARVVDCMYDKERELLAACGVPVHLLNNVIDAIGINLRASGRMLRGRSR